MSILFFTEFPYSQVGYLRKVAKVFILNLLNGDIAIIMGFIYFGHDNREKLLAQIERHIVITYRL